jgi:ribosome maturation factor RimP
MTQTPLEQSIEEIITPSLNSMGFEVVRVRLMESKGKRGKTLQIMAERQDGSMSLEDCVEVNNTVSTLLDVEDPINGEYNLEISSPGMDRPLVKLSDFEKYTGYEIRLSTNEPVDGQRKFRGKIKAVEQEDILLALSDGSGKESRIPYGLVHSAQLIITDEMLKKAVKKAG